MFDQQLTMDGRAEDLAPRHEQPRMFDFPRSIEGQQTMVLPTCDLCGDAIQAGEKFTDDGSEIAHDSCVRGWFARNYGRESL